MSISTVIADLLFPKYCFNCFKLGHYICLSCGHRLKIIMKDVCPYCEKGSYFGLTHPLCRKKYGLDGLKSIYHYDDLVKKIIKQIKYRLVTEAVDDFLKTIPQAKMTELLFYKQLAKEIKIIPVPLHKNRLLQRGFNQSQFMAQFFWQMLKFPIIDNLVVRLKNTTPQVEFKKPKERYQNILGAFSFNQNININEIQAKNFIIFDDVWTTGWTIKEIAKILKKGGADKVFALTVAK